MSEDGTCHPRNALARLLEQWRSYLPHMRQGLQPLNAIFRNADLPHLAGLLEGRIDILSEWLVTDDLWEGLAGDYDV